MQSLCRCRLGVFMVGLVACGDDGASVDGQGSSSTADSDSSGGPTSTDPVDESSTAEPDSSSSATSVDTSTGSADDTSSSSTGTPNQPPDAIDDEYLVAMDATPLQVAAAMGVLANDVDPDGDPLVVDDGDPLSLRGAAVIVDVDGAFDYAPPLGMWGADVFGYVASDEQGGTDMANVRVIVAPTTVSVGDLDGDAVGFPVLGITDGDETGWFVAGGGDVNGDGFGDLVVAARSADAAASSEGRVWVVFGKDDGDAVDLADAVLDGTGFAIDGVAAFDQTGHAAAIAGDVNGDGLADIVVGAPGADPLGNDEGIAFVVFGKDDGNTVALASLAADGAGFTIAGLAGDDNLGAAVAGGGDIDGDGLDDVIVGAPQADVGGLGNAGRVWVVHGKSDTAPVDLAAVTGGTGGFVIAGVGADHRAGDAVDAIGDANGDGLDDLVVGAPLADPGGGNSGQVYVVWGKSDGNPVDLADVIAGTGGFAIDGEQGIDQAGDTVARAGDIDGDGLADLVLGAPGAEGDINLVGRSYVVLGKTDGALVDLVDVVAGVGGFVIEGEAESDLSGWSVGGGGDVDGDGLSDVVVGAQGVDAAGFGAGRTYVVYGRADTTAVALLDVANGVGGFAIDGEGANDVSGWACGGAGDVSGDGLADVVIGAVDASGGTGSGRAYALFGGDFRGHVTLAGTDLDDTIDGTMADETLLGGLGDDTLRTYGGSDVIYAGPGDDTIALTSTELLRIDGGTGVDTLVLDAADVQLELDVASDLAIVGIESIDITGSGDNALFLETRDLRALSDTSNELVVVGDAGDQVVADLAGAGFVDLGVIDGFHVWSSGVLVLRVTEDVEAFVGV